jgi:hypothetical protein
VLDSTTWQRTGTHLLLQSVPIWAGRNAISRSDAMHIGFTNLAQYGALKTYQGTLDAMSTMPVEQVQRIPYRDDGSQRQLRHDTDLLTFPTASVCFDCGFSIFNLASKELLELEGTIPVTPQLE